MSALCVTRFVGAGTAAALIKLIEISLCVRASETLSSSPVDQMLAEPFTGVTASIQGCPKSRCQAVWLPGQRSCSGLLMANFSPYFPMVDKKTRKESQKVL